MSIRGKLIVCPLTQDSHPILTISNSSSKATRSVVTLFHTEPRGVEETKICSNHPGHMTNMATTPIYGKKPLKILFFRANQLMALKLSMKHWVLEYYQDYTYDDHGLTLT